MIFTQKIYLYNKPLILTTSAEKFVMRHPATAGYLFLKGALAGNFRLAQRHLEAPQNKGVVIADVSVKKLQQELKKVFIPIVAGGGLVKDPRGNLLLIFRRGKWDLPKGKQDAGESVEACAQREVREETGLPELRIGSKICKTYHAYKDKGQNILKTTHWFHMEVAQNYALYPQEEEDIEEARWVAAENLDACLGQSYEAIRDVLTAAGLGK